MKATAFVQVVPKRRGPGGAVRELRIGNVTKTYPRIPEPGALVVMLEVELDPVIFDTPTMKVELTGTEAEMEAAVVPIPVQPSVENGLGETVVGFDEEG